MTKKNKTTNLTPRKILGIVSNVSDISVESIVGASRKRDVATVRAVYMLLCRQWGIKNRNTAKCINRATCTASIMARRCLELYEFGDALICNLTDKCNKIIKTNEL